MIKEIYALVKERLMAARDAPPSVYRACVVEELDEVLSIIAEIADLYDEEVE